MKYIICGLNPGYGGVPKLLEYLENRVDPKEYTFIYPLNCVKKTFEALIYRICNKLEKKKLVRRIFRIPTSNKILSFYFNKKIKKLKKSEVILLHHQSIGLKNTLRLIKHNYATIYVMDNAFFCIRSYNYISGEKEECLRCLDGEYSQAELLNCNPFPSKIGRKENIDFLKKLELYAKEINFLTLSKKNADLVKLHFKNVGKVSCIYFLTEDLLKDLDEMGNSGVHNIKDNYDFVFHGSDIAEKGFEYCIKLSERLSQYKWFFPTSIDLGVHKNIITKKTTWEDGLKDAVVGAKVVLTPSLWSNTPEAATLKSFIYNGSVAIVKRRYGFSNEIPKDAFIELTGEIDEDVKILDQYIKTGLYVDVKSNGQKFIQQYIKMCKKRMATELSIQE